MVKGHQTVLSCPHGNDDDDDIFRTCSLRVAKVNELEWVQIGTSVCWDLVYPYLL